MYFLFICVFLIALLYAGHLIYQLGITQGQLLKQDQFQAEAINAGAAEFDAAGVFRFKPSH